MSQSILKETLQKHGFSTDEAVLQKLSRFYDLLCAANEKTNLTRIISAADAAEKHFADSLAPLWLKADVALPENARCLDMGAGAGFPSVPLAIVRPDLRWTALDAVGKKVDFLHETARQLGLDLTAIHARAEDLAHLAAYREQFDLCVARAVAPMHTLCEYTLPFLRVGGELLCWKGPAAQEELEQARKAIYHLGGEGKGCFFYTLSEQAEGSGDGQNLTRCLIRVRKIRQTPAQFPRKAGIPKSRPIGVES